MKRRPILVSGNGTREYLTVTIAKHTRTRIDRICASTHLARGRLVDIALASIEPCGDCRGTGRENGPLGLETVECAGCRGSKVVPSER